MMPNQKKKKYPELNQILESKFGQIVKAIPKYHN